MECNTHEDAERFSQLTQTALDERLEELDMVIVDAAGMDAAERANCSGCKDEIEIARVHPTARRDFEEAESNRVPYVVLEL